MLGIRSIMSCSAILTPHLLNSSSLQNIQATFVTSKKFTDVHNLVISKAPNCFYASTGKAEDLQLNERHTSNLHTKLPYLQTDLMKNICKTLKTENTSLHAVLNSIKQNMCITSWCQKPKFTLRNKNIDQVQNNTTSANTSVNSAKTSAEGVTQCSSNDVKHSVVYTKGGDKGTSALFTGERRRKNDIVFEALGALDELTSHVGLARAMLREMMKTNNNNQDNEHGNMLMASLEDIQQQIMNVSTIVATPAADETKVEGPLLKLLQSYTMSEKTHTMEKDIDVMDARLTPLRIFILPGGGNVASAQLHVCRTVCRLAERRMVDVRDKYGEQYSDHLRQATVYVNRLSDYFFVAARSVAEEEIARKNELEESN